MEKIWKQQLIFMSKNKEKLIIFSYEKTFLARAKNISPTPPKS
jgi:hypothetical protein